MLFVLIFELAHVLVVTYFLETLYHVAPNLVVVSRYLIIVRLARPYLLQVLVPVNFASLLNPLLGVIVFKNVNVAAVAKGFQQELRTVNAHNVPVATHFIALLLVLGRWHGHLAVQDYVIVCFHVQILHLFAEKIKIRQWQVLVDANETKTFQR